jgi:predicted dehydrogenase
VRFGLIGTGYWAREVHAASVASHPDAELVGVWGRDPAKAASVATAFGAEPYADLDAMLDAVDAVTFSVPPYVQAELAPRAAEAGKHLLLEKPVAMDVPSADRIVEAVERSGVAALVFFTERFLADREAWLDTLRTEGGCLGADATWLGSLLDPGNPFANSPWRKTEGALWDVGPHALSVVVPVLGPISAVAGAQGFGDLVHLVLTHESGATSTLHLSLTMPPAATRSGLEFYRADGWHARPDSPFDALGAHRSAVGDLIAAASTGQIRHRCDVWFGRDVVAMLERIQHAI